MNFLSNPVEFIILQMGCYCVGRAIYEGLVVLFHKVRRDK